MVQSIKERLEQFYSEFKTDKEREEFEKNYQMLFNETFSNAKREFYRIEEQNEKAYQEANKAIDDLRKSEQELDLTLGKLLNETTNLKKSLESLADRIEPQKDFVFFDEPNDTNNGKIH
ncbi:MAG TPA: hypothetical protein VJB35_03065 [Candidatus Nanoarchaeia archaeon]|nr:hypothetical protein [Candidatus Nanoarchaeia archaeon]